MSLPFSQEVKQILDKAQSYAKSFHNFYLGVEHLFFAFLDYNKNLQIKLSQYDIDRDILIKSISNWSQVEPEKTVPHISPTPRLEHIIGMAVAEAGKNRLSEVPLELLWRALCLEGGSVIFLAISKFGCFPDNLKECITSSQSFPLVKAPKISPLSGLLAKLGRDLTQMARDGKLEPVIGRKEEIKRVMQILTRKTKNNPLLVGEAGVGKTAVVAALAQKIADGDVPKQLSACRIVEISVASLLAGMKHRGEFEERLQNIISEVIKDKSIIVFIDEIHTIIGAGDPKGPLDMSNILKPVLAGGDFSLIGATTNEEYRKYIANDAALERRFQPVLIPEPSETETLEIIKGVLPKYEAHHEVKFLPQSLETAISLAVRYMTERHLPDKVLDLLDEAASRAKFKSLPPTVKGSVDIVVEPEHIAEVVSLWTGIPVADMTEDETTKLANLEELLKQRVIGQDRAVECVAKTVKLMRLGLGAPKRPAGVFLFLGPTGVGKTELAKALTQVLFGNERSLIRIDMSEFMDKHSAAKLIGAPPGYIGYSEGGQLTNEVRSKPYSVILLDEIEKANKEIFDIFLQVFDDGRLTDGQGRTVNFCNTIIIMTSNIGSELIARQLDSASIAAIDNDIWNAISMRLREHFRVEFLNRIDDIILFSPFSEEQLNLILDLQLSELTERFQEKGIALELTSEARKFILREGYNPAFGARPLRRALENLLAKPLAEAIIASGHKLSALKKPETSCRVKITKQSDADILEFEFQDKI